MPVPSRLGIVTLGVADLDRSALFYEALGWEMCTSSMDEIKWFRTADTHIGLFPADELAADAGLSAPPELAFRGITLAINVDREEDVQACLDDAVGAGGRLVKPATRMEWGGVSGYFADPDGFSWEVAFNPSFPINEQGRLHIP